MFDFRLDNSTRYFSQWSDKTDLFGQKGFDLNILRQGGSVYDMIVPTVQFVKECTLLQMLLRNQNNVYLCGATGTSKTSVVHSVFARCLGTTVVDAQQPNVTNY